MKEVKHKINKFPQKNGRYSLNDYYLALKYRNLDTRMQELAWGIVNLIDYYKKSRKSSAHLGALKSILSEYLDVVASWTEDNKLELTVVSINIPDELKPAFLPDKKHQNYNKTKKEKTRG